MSATTIARVAIVDDDDRGARVMSEVVRDAGFDPTIVASNRDTLETFSSVVREQSDAALCDHRLQYSGLYTFDGAHLVATLTENAFPAILITQFPMDADVSIRKWRHLIPVLLKRADADDVTQIREGFEYCVQELRGQPSTVRRAHRSLVRIADLSNETADDVIDAFIPSWNPRQAVRFPKSLLGPLQDHAVAGARFFAQVNIGAPNAEDLFLHDFELGPEVDPDDGLS